MSYSVDTIAYGYGRMAPEQQKSIFGGKAKELPMVQSLIVKKGYKI